MNGRTVTCRQCRESILQEDAESVDVSRDEEYYPKFEHYCRGCFE